MLHFVHSLLISPLLSDEKFWSENVLGPTKDVRLLVKRVFITNDLGSEDPLPKWISWVKAIIDGKCPEYFLCYYG